MAYQNVGKCRFYIDTISYLKSTGNEYSTDLNSNLFRFDPINQSEIIINNSNSFEITFNEDLKMLFDTDNFYMGFLNHDITNNGLIIPTESSAPVLNGDISTDTTGGTTTLNIENKGTTIFTGTINPDTPTISLNLPESVEEPVEEPVEEAADQSLEFNLGSFILGSYYDMPSADLELSMDVEFDGFDTTQTMGGSTLTNVRYAGSPYWINNGSKNTPFSIGDSNLVAKRNGRRVWNLSFSYISDEDLFASNYMGNNYLETEDNYNSNDLELVNSNNTFYYNINNDKSFISQVLNKVGNGQRFLFQPDNTNNNPDQFAICVLDQDSFSISQVAFKSYNISLKIKEVW